ncbi:hypothetical protein CVIRNUC_000998 [Coccomyxa viridis]|uniref:Uncharacterized protein n=1 Tax=Coccomyxa viridis TaxID=1274662 RepID=A0AAV1HT37_9CHLO|nr:hypothetical protein CVIRNUC_000998 [Coccomyxa viridis]
MSTAEEEPKSKGAVKWFNSSKGFGFITPEDGGSDLFVHQSSIDAEGFRSLRENEPVEFIVEEGEDGRTKAVHVTGPDGAPPQGAPRRVFYGGMPPQQMQGMPPPFMPRGGYPMGPYGGGRGRGPFMPGRGRGERRPPPGTPGVSSGVQVVVHNLPWGCTWQNLKDAFAASTQSIERADVIIDSSGRSRGFGTVRYSTPDDAQAATQIMNGAEIGGRTITVRIDRFA